MSYHKDQKFISEMEKYKKNLEKLDEEKSHYKKETFFEFLKRQINESSQSYNKFLNANKDKYSNGTEEDYRTLEGKSDKKLKTLEKINEETYTSNGSYDDGRTLEGKVDKHFETFEKINEETYTSKGSYDDDRTLEGKTTTKNEIQEGYVENLSVENEEFFEGEKSSYSQNSNSRKKNIDILLKDKEDIKRVIVLSEIFGKPKGLE